MHTTSDLTVEQDTKIYWIYALKLEQGKYYIGSTSKKYPKDRIKTHGGFYGAKWTQIYKPLQTLKLKKLGNVSREEAESYEQGLRLKYVKRYGYNNVRGGMLNSSGNHVKLGNHYIRQAMWNLSMGLILITTGSVVVLIYPLIK